MSPFMFVIGEVHKVHALYTENKTLRNALVISWLHWYENELVVRHRIDRTLEDDSWTCALCKRFLKWEPVRCSARCPLNDVPGSGGCAAEWRNYLSCRSVGHWCVKELPTRYLDAVVGMKERLGRELDERYDDWRQDAKRLQNIIRSRVYRYRKKQ